MGDNVMRDNDRLNAENERANEAARRLNEERNTLQAERNRLNREKNDLIQVNARLEIEQQALFEEKTNVEKEKQILQDSFNKTKADLARKAMILYIYLPSATFLLLILLGTYIFFRRRSKVKVEQPQPNAVSAITNKEDVPDQSPSISLTEIEVPSMLKAPSMRKRRSRIDEW